MIVPAFSEAGARLEVVGGGAGHRPGGLPGGWVRPDGGVGRRGDHR